MNARVLLGGLETFHKGLLFAPGRIATEGLKVQQSLELETLNPKPWTLNLKP